MLNYANKLASSVNNYIKGLTHYSCVCCGAYCNNRRQRCHLSYVITSYVSEMILKLLF